MESWRMGRGINMSAYVFPLIEGCTNHCFGPLLGRKLSS